MKPYNKNNKTFTLEQCQQLMGNTIDFDPYKEHFIPTEKNMFINKYIPQSTNVIKQHNLINILNSQTDVFITYDWGINNGLSNHVRVSNVNEALKAKGYKTWFDTDKLEGNIKKHIGKGIDNARCILVFITKEYIEKVAGDNNEDNCQLEFNYASRKKTAAKMIPIIMDETVKDTSKWYGEFGMVLGGELNIRLFDDKKCFNTAIEQLHQRILSLLGKQIKQIFNEIKTYHFFNEVHYSLTSIRQNGPHVAWPKLETDVVSPDYHHAKSEEKILNNTMANETKIYYIPEKKFENANSTNLLLSNATGNKPDTIEIIYSEGEDDGEDADDDDKTTINLSIQTNISQLDNTVNDVNKNINILHKDYIIKKKQMSETELVNHERIYQNTKYKYMRKIASIDDKIKELNEQIVNQIRQKNSIETEFKKKKNIKMNKFVKQIIRLKNNIKYKCFSCLL